MEANETAPCTGTDQDPTRIDFTVLVTKRNRCASFIQENPDALYDFVRMTAETLRESPPSLKDVASYSQLAGAITPNRNSLYAEIVLLLAPFICGEKPVLNVTSFTRFLREHALRIANLAHESGGWFFVRFPFKDMFIAQQEDRVAWNLCTALIPLFGQDTVRRSTGRILHQQSESHAPMIAAAPIELIESWITMPKTCPTETVLNVAASDRLAQDLALTIAAGIYPPFKAALEDLSETDRERVAAILRRNLQTFAGHARFEVTGCSHAMHITLCDLLNELCISLLPLRGERKSFIPVTIALQIFFLAFYNASMMVPESCQLPRGTAAIAEEYFPVLRGFFDLKIVPDILA